MVDRLRVLLIAPHISNAATGEAFVCFKWAEALSHRVDLTVAAFQSARHSPLASQLPLAKVHVWPAIQAPRGITAFRSMLKPDYPAFFRRVHKYMAKEAGHFDLAHQFLPMAMRYPTPLRGFGIPYIIGPLGGGLETPPGLASQVASESWFSKLRVLDKYRHRYDFWLRATYSEAELVLGVAPYIRDTLRSIPLKRYENIMELGIDGLAPTKAIRLGNGLKLLHVGRGVRTKGLREVIRAVHHLRDRPNITLVSAGGGEEAEQCKREAEALGIADRITFLGRVPREKIEELYAEADVFVFPSFREPTGGVLYEAMRWGLPIVTANYGGPAFIVNENCGILVDVNNSAQMTHDIATAISRLADDVGLRHRLSEGARARVGTELWSIKADRLVQWYEEVAGCSHPLRASGAAPYNVCSTR